MPCGFGTRQTDDAHGEVEGLITPDFNISSKIWSSATSLERGGFLGCYRMGLAEPVSTLCPKNM